MILLTGGWTGTLELLLQGHRLSLGHFMLPLSWVGGTEPAECATE